MRIGVTAKHILYKIIQEKCEFWCFGVTVNILYSFLPLHHVTAVFYPRNRLTLPVTHTVQKTIYKRVHLPSLPVSGCSDDQ